MSTLLATSGPHVGRRFTLGKLTRMGRAPDNEIVLSDNLVSRYHATIEAAQGGFVVSDLGSKNGIEINDARHTEHRLRRGDRISIGETTLVFEAPQELKTARFTNTLIHLDPEQDETMRILERPSTPEAASGEATALVLKLAQVFDAASEELPDVLHKILSHLVEMMGASAGSILLRSRGDEVVPLTAIAHNDELHINRDATHTAMTEARAVLTASFFTPKGKSSVRRPRKAMIVPMLDHGNVFGAIHLERTEGSDYTLKDVGFLQALSRLVSGPVHQAIRIDQLGQTAAGTAPKIIGKSKAMMEVREQLKRVAASDATVLITGETGTGKELIARALHDQSNRRAGPFIAINCAAIPSALIESELFGYERGAFTGAEKRKRGKVEMADNGTLFLDEIGEMDIDLQPKLLRFLEEQIFYRVGGVRPIQTDVRILAATNRDVEEAVREGRLRSDLLYRLNVVSIETPALRDRRDDIRITIEHFAPDTAARLNRPYLGIDDSAWRALENYTWPGNVRELLQSLERALILSDDGILKREHFQIPDATEDRESTGGGHITPTGSRHSDTDPPPGGDYPPTLAEVEKRAILRALHHSKGNKVRAAEILGIHRNTLRKKVEQYRITI